MGQKSNVDRLPNELRKELLSMLKNSLITQAEIVAKINEKAGEVVLSKSGLNRYKLRMDKFIEKSRQAREVADLFIEKAAGENSNSMGKVLNEQIRIAVFDLMQEFDELKNNENFPADKVSDVLYKVSRSLKELEQAEKLNAEREEKIRKRILEETAEQVEVSAKKNGVSKESMELILAEVFGISK